MRYTGIILCAGSGTRMGCNKMLMRIGGRTPIDWCVDAFLCSEVDHIVIAASESTLDFCEKISCSKPIKVVMGGETRGQSVYNALMACEDTDIVAIHDGARCLITPEIINESLKCAVEHGSAIAAIREHDTVRTRAGETLNRDELMLMQTPQTFVYEKILSAYSKVGTVSNTDDCGVFIDYGETPYYFKGDFLNQKLTTAADISFFEGVLSSRKGVMRVGFGEDTHRLCAGRDLILGGVKIDFELGLLGHSDADVLCHAICDALLGACALGDIGQHFPDTDLQYKGANSIELLKQVAKLLSQNSFIIDNVDATIVAQKPKLAPHIISMRENISRAINIPLDCVSVKATTSEGTGAEGRLECITVRACASLRKLTGIYN